MVKLNNCKSMLSNDHSDNLLFHVQNSNMKIPLKRLSPKCLFPQSPGSPAPLTVNIILFCHLNVRKYVALTKKFIS